MSLEIVGPLPHFEAMAVVAGASVGFSLLHDLPNYRASMPTKVIEYLAMGVPVVASDLPGHPRGPGRPGRGGSGPPGRSRRRRRRPSPACWPRRRGKGRHCRRRWCGVRLVWPDEEVRRVYLAAARR